METILLYVTGAVACVWIGMAIERKRTDKRIRMMMHLPEKSESFNSVEETARSMQGFLSWCCCVVNPLGVVSYNNELTKELNKVQWEMTCAVSFSPVIHTLVDLCHKMGIEIVLRRKDTGEEKVY